jgi:hypothetical protein
MLRAKSRPDRTVSSPFYGTDDIVQRCYSGDILHVNTLSGKVYRGLDYAGDLIAQHPFDSHGAVRTRHPRYGKLSLCRDDAVAGIVDRICQLPQVNQVRIKGDRCPLRGKIYLCIPYAFQFLEASLDRHGAVGTGHAGKLQADAFINC